MPCSPPMAIDHDCHFPLLRRPWMMSCSCFLLQPRDDPDVVLSPPCLVVSPCGVGKESDLSNNATRRDIIAQVLSCVVLCCLMLSCLVLSYPIILLSRPHLVFLLSCLMLFVLSRFDLCRIAVSCLFLPVFSCPILSCLVFHYLIFLSCVVFPWLLFSSVR
jgi:hypothetical protein